MSVKTALVVIGNTDSHADLTRAAEVASEVGAHLSVAVLGFAIPPTGSEFDMGAAWLDVRDADMKRLEAIKDDAAEVCNANGLSFDVDVVYTHGTIVEAEILRRALYADIVMIGDGVRQDRMVTRAVVEGALFEAHKPLFLIPKSRPTSLNPKRILVAWNSRPESARAVREALEMTLAADEVHVVLVDPNSSPWVNGGEPGADIATYLARHGLKVVVEQLTSGGRPVQDVLKQHALEINADLLVVGAYGHSRMRERVFGGVTASLLKNCDYPVLLAR